MICQDLFEDLSIEQRNLQQLFFSVKMSPFGQAGDIDNQGTGATQGFEQA